MSEDEVDVALFIAGRDGEWDIVKQMAERFNKRENAYGVAAELGNWEFVRSAVLERNTKRNTYLLARAACGGQQAMCHRLLDIRAEPIFDHSIGDMVDRQPFDLRGMLQALIDHVRTASEKVPNIDPSALVGASGQGQLEVAKLLILRSANVNAPRDDGYTPLILASQNGHAEVVRYLLSLNADASSMTASHGTTALIQAAQEGHLEVVKLLVANRADPNLSMTYAGLTALIRAAGKGHFEIAKVLIQSGAHVNATTTDNRATPLIYAARNGSMNTVQLLLQHRADLTATNADGHSVMDIARKFNRDEIERYLTIYLSKWCYGCSKIVEAPLKRCRCHKVKYCNTDCQRKHWPEHKPECKKT